MALGNAGGSRGEVAPPEDLPVGVHRYSLAGSAAGEGTQIHHASHLGPQKRMPGVSDDPPAGVDCRGLATSATGEGAQIRHAVRLRPQKRMLERLAVEMNEAAPDDLTA